ncbi:hypothetical protein H4Q26_011334 [Puccinia striiformis f. sp. tritici PST-130]|nr:hypothetical protein H4Q26_011334 [Puccinia striiformis f. sp. tritici PST-130]
MFSSGPSLELMTAKFGSPVSQPSPTNTCSSTVNDSGHAATSHDKTALNFSRRALYPMSYEERLSIFIRFSAQLFPWTTVGGPTWAGRHAQRSPSLSGCRVSAKIKSIANRTNTPTIASPSARAPPSDQRITYG